MKTIVSFVVLFAVSACSTATPPAPSTGSPATEPSAEPSTPPAPPMRPGIEAFPGSQIFLPPKTPAPGVVMLHGSEGGSEPYIRDFAAEIAKEGFVVVTLCWFACTDKPSTIDRIPLESVVEIGAWLQGAPEVDSGKVGLFGWSRGAEMSLLVTSLVGAPEPFRAVAVHAASDTIVAGFDPATADTPPDYGGILEKDPKTGQLVPAPSWTWKGEPLYGEPKSDFSVPGPRILVEKYTGPVYVSHGEKDEIWEAVRSRRVVATRNASPGLVTESHFWPGEGHVLSNPVNIATQRAEIVSFFQRKLAP